MRGRTRLLLAILIVLAGGALVFSAVALIDVAKAIGAQAPLVAVDGADGVAFLAGIAMIALTGLFLPQIAGFRARKSNGRTRRPQHPGSVLVLLAGGCLILCPFAPTIVLTIVGASAERRGYLHCPRPTWPRRQPDRWVLASPKGPLARCPSTAPPRPQGGGARHPSASP